ncbi:hypothetical protein BDR26DRAFT_874816 [Obelidium mucronatum]|nr:hypothetical protein BDR26DRAFT_874816 [Obelidium mucronatum]
MPQTRTEAVHFVWDWENLQTQRQPISAFSAKVVATVLAGGPPGITRVVGSMTVAVGGTAQLSAARHRRLRKSLAQLSAAGWQTFTSRVTGAESADSCLAGRSLRHVLEHAASQWRGVLVVMSNDHGFGALVAQAWRAGMDTAVVYSAPSYSLATYRLWAPNVPDPVLVRVAHLLACPPNAFVRCHTDRGMPPPPPDTIARLLPSSQSRLVLRTKDEARVLPWGVQRWEVLPSCSDFAARGA